MTAKGHVILAITPLTAAYGSSLIAMPEVLIPVVLGSLFNDIDEPASYIGRKFFFLSGLFRELGLKHRGFTHFLIIPLVLMILAYLAFEGGILFWFAFGMLMHDIGDMLTKGGIVSFFYPFAEGKRAALLPEPLRFKTFSFTEKIVIFVLILINLVNTMGVNYV
jgi:inner membrane protein